jgi:hypothetical protein
VSVFVCSRTRSPLTICACRDHYISNSDPCLAGHEQLHDPRYDSQPSLVYMHISRARSALAIGHCRTRRQFLEPVRFHLHRYVLERLPERGLRRFRYWYGSVPSPLASPDRSAQCGPRDITALTRALPKGRRFASAQPRRPTCARASTAKTTRTQARSR